MLKAKVSRGKLGWKAVGGHVTIMTELATLVDAVVDEVCKKAELDRDAALTALFRTIEEAHEYEGDVTEDE